MKKSQLLLGFALTLFFFSSSFLAAQQLDHVLDEAIVKLKTGTDIHKLQNDLGRIDGFDTQFRVVRKLSKQMNIYKVYFNHNNIDEYEFRKQLARHNDVQVAQVNHLLTKRQTVPDDPFIVDQWQWINPNDADVDADLAWDITTGGLTANGDEIVVAVFDDGGDLDHPDLIDNNWINTHEIAGNGIDDDNNGYIDDVYGWNFGGGNNNVDGGNHGVNVAGMIGGVGNNMNQGTGINWNVKIMNINYGGISEAEVIEFYAYALDQRERYNTSNGTEGSFVVATNSSWGIDQGDPDSAPLWCGFYDTLGEAGILSCGATTNQNLNVDVVGDLPTACPSEFMVAVTATNDNDNRTFSGYGATTIDVGAPGDNIYTTQSGGGYTNTTGTSFASPLTAGVIALIYSAPCSNLAALALADPQLAAEQVRDALYEGAEDVGNLAGDVVYGRVNAFNSVQIVMNNCGPCPTPVGIQASDILDVSVTLNWVNPTDAQSNDLRYREVGATDWIEVANATMPYNLFDLTACTDYEVQVAAFCTDEESGYSASYTFQSEGCCIAPDGLAISAIDNSSGTATWSSIFAAQSYNLQWRELGAPDWITENLTNPEFAFSGLTECTLFEVQVQTVCANATTDYTEAVVFSTFGCGACTDFTYCSSVGESIVDEWIGEFILADINNLNLDAPPIGYTDYTGTIFTTDLATFGTYPVSISPEYESTLYEEYFKVYIDYNQDGEFDEATELAYDGGELTNTTSTGEITIPETALEGLTRLRVIMQWNGAPNPCGEYDYGETEDYCVNIVMGTPVCSLPGNLATTGITDVAATFNWSTVMLAESYNVDYRALGAADWISINTPANSLTVDGLINCAEYEWRVESICPNGELSGFSASTEFTTTCVCDAPINLDTMNLSFTSVDLSWDIAANASAYRVRYKLQAAGPGSWVAETITAANTSVMNLDDCSDYEFQVRTICSNINSDWSPSFNFTTHCITSLDEVENGVESLTLFPNPFKGTITSRFSLSESTNLTIEVYSATGKRLASEAYDLNAGAQNILIPGLEKVSQGIYFVSMTTDKGIKMRRIVKQ